MFDDSLIPTEPHLSVWIALRHINQNLDDVKVAVVRGSVQSRLAVRVHIVHVDALRDQ